MSRPEWGRGGIHASRCRTEDYGLEYIWNRIHNMDKKWEVIFHDEFEEEFKAFDKEWQDELLAHAVLLRDYGPIFGRPTVDTLKGSRHANMKELRFDWRGKSWRVAFAFDPGRSAILLAGGRKAGGDPTRVRREH